MAFELDQLRVERVSLEIGYHATYTFYGLKGVLAERWGHGPIFGAVGEAGTGQINLTPVASEGQDERLLGVAGIRASALIAEGPWARRVKEVAQPWFEDVLTVLKPQRVVSYKVEVFGVCPIKGDPVRVSERLRARYYDEEALRTVIGEDLEPQHAAVEVMWSGADYVRSMVLGVVGPPHTSRFLGSFFAFPSAERDQSWGLGARLVYAGSSEEGFDAPLDDLMRTLEDQLHEWSRVGRATFPQLVGL